MSGLEDNVAIMGDWMSPNPSPRSFFSSNEDESGGENRTGLFFSFPENTNPRQGGDEANALITEPRMTSRGGLVERLAARAGFNAPRLNTENIRHTELSKSSEVRSPYLTIPPGLSPTSLLDSPVFLTNSLVLPSPTTGKFPFAFNGSSILMANDDDDDDDDDKGKENVVDDSSSFAFKPIVDSESIPYFNATNKVHSSYGVSSHSSGIRTLPENKRSSDQVYNRVGVVDNSPPPDDEDGDQRSSGDPNLGEDGYNWRKYGQKQVKGSEFPRSYYKCTHVDCPVKKKVERSHEGHITEIIYKGAHNHAKPPPPSRRSSLNSSNAFGESDQGNGDLVWSTMQKGSVSDWREENVEATSQVQNGSQSETGDGVDQSSTFSNDEEEEDRVTRGSVSLGYDGEGDESESKRRRIETYASEMSGATRAIREPRVVVQTTSEVDILDDGYRWRKYGQKVVKGNPNPRSYYKCTSAGCNVRKHVERASHDLKSVITTYEGKHNHDVPAARNSSHMNSGGGSHNQQSSSGAGASSHIHRPEPAQMHNNAARFDRPPLGPYGLRPQLGSGPGYGFGMNQAGLAGLGLARLGPNQIHPYLGHHQQARGMNDMGFMMPKPEPKLETDSGSGLGLNQSDGSSVYQQLMSRLPLGP